MPGCEVEWRDIPGWEGLYEASTSGSIRAVARTVQSHRLGKPFTALRSAKLLKAYQGADRWLRVTLYASNGKVSRNMAVARLVLLAHVGPHTSLEVIRFLDGNYGNCALDNLAAGEPANDEEEWKAVVGWEEFYDVSNLGRVRAKPRVAVHRNAASEYERMLAGRIMKLAPATGTVGLPYPVVSLRKTGRRTKTVTVHRLVCEAFHGPQPSQHHEVRHLDGDASNAKSNNLAWGTKAQNEEDKIFTGFAKLANITAEQARALASFFQKPV